jgi:hypothetical protein
MRFAPIPSRSNSLAFGRTLRFNILHRAVSRKLVCFAVIANLLLWPAPGVNLGPILNPVSAMASTVGSTVSAVSSMVGELGSRFSGLAASVVFIPTGPIVVPVPLLLRPFQLGAGTARELTMAERTARVSFVKVAPHKLVGYVGDSVTFVAMGTDLAGQPAHGAKFTWESSQLDKLTIDEAGRATLLTTTGRRRR